MPTMQQLSNPAQSGAPVRINENFESLEAVAVYGKDPATTSGLTWGFLGGRWGGIAVTAATVTLTNAATNYVVAHRETGAVSVSTATTNWNNPSLYARVYQLTTAGSLVTAVQDHRAGPFGVLGSIPSVRSVNPQSAAYTLTGLDAYTTVLHPSADTTARTFTVPANASVAYRLGTVLEIVNQASAGVVTIAITSDTMRLEGAGTTGSRTLAANGRATLRKITATEWLIGGAGLT